MNDYSRTIVAKQAEASAAKRELALARKAYVTATDALQDAEDAHRLIRDAAQIVQQRAHARIAETVGRCLSAVFEEPYKFNIAFEQKRGRTEASLTFERDGYVVDPLSQAGGGVVDVSSFALRLASLMASRPARRRLLVLDEPFKHLSPEFRHAVRFLLESLAAELDVQMIIVTHDPLLKQMGKVVEL